MTRLAVVSLTVLLASTAVAAYADPGDAHGRYGRGPDGGGEARSEWRQRGGPQQNSDQQNGARPDMARPDRGSRDDTPRDTGQRPNGGLYVPRNTPPPSVAQSAPMAPQAPPAAVANNGGRAGGRGADGLRDGQGWRGGQGGPPSGFQGADQGNRRSGGGDPSVARSRDYGANGGDQRARGGDANRSAQDESRGRGVYGLEGGRNVERGRQGDGRRYGDGGRDNPGSDRWTERGHDRATYDNRGGDRRYDGDRGYRGRPGDGHGYRDRDHGRSWYNPQYFHQEYRATYRYRAPPYRYPHGWFERTWYYGDYLPGGWYATSYYLDWRAFGLGYPPIGCEWIRVGRDALLVDIWSGEVLSVYYDLFW